MATLLKRALASFAATNDWRHKGNCVRVPDKDLFYPVGNSGPALPQIDDAKAVCDGCPVRADCLAWALEHNEQGVWGGLTEDERRKLKRHAARSRPAPVTPIRPAPVADTKPERKSA